MTKTAKTNATAAVYKSVEELAKELGISRQAAYRELNQGLIPSIRIGKRFIIPRAAIQEWLKTAGQSAGDGSARGGFRA